MYNTLAPFQTHTWSSEMGDFIGVESCIDLKPNEESPTDGGGREPANCVPRRQRKLKRREKREFPPPLPPSSWVLRRHRTCDGRLIITKEQGGLPEIFRSRRSNNRLTIELVSLHDEDERGSGNVNLDRCDDGGRTDRGDGVRNGSPAAAAADEESSPVKCCKYDGIVRSNPCMVGMAVPAIKHVQI